MTAMVLTARKAVATQWFRVPRRWRIALLSVLAFLLLVQVLEAGLISLPPIVLVVGYYVFVLWLVFTLGRHWWRSGR